MMCHQVERSRYMSCVDWFGFVLCFFDPWMRSMLRLARTAELQTGVVVLISVSIAFVITVVFYSVVHALKNKGVHSEDTFL